MDSGWSACLLSPPLVFMSSPTWALEGTCQGKVWLGQCPKLCSHPPGILLTAFPASPHLLEPGTGQDEGRSRDYLAWELGSRCRHVALSDQKPAHGRTGFSKCWRQWWWWWGAASAKKDRLGTDVEASPGCSGAILSGVAPEALGGPVPNGKTGVLWTVGLGAKTLGSTHLG